MLAIRLLMHIVLIHVDKVTVQYQFEFDGGRLGAGGTGRLLINGDTVAKP